LKIDTHMLGGEGSGKREAEEHLLPKVIAHPESQGSLCAAGEWAWHSGKSQE
jgi:hypothetical protein